MKKTVWWMDVLKATVTDDDGDKTVVTNKRYFGDESVTDEVSMYHNGCDQFLDEHGIDSIPDDFLFDIDSDDDDDEPSDPYEAYMLSRSGF